MRSATEKLRAVLDRVGWWTDQCQHGFRIPQCPWDKCAAIAALAAASMVLPSKGGV